MRLRSLTLSNFRCFGPEPVRVGFVDLTTIVGGNGAGKTAVLQALTRLFGTSQQERTLRRADFHVPPGVEPDTVHSLNLWVEVEFEFPELAGDDAEGAGSSIPEFFRQMVVAGPGQTPYCRIRLEGKWTRSNLPDGDIEEEMNWLCSAEANVPQERRHRVQAGDRSQVHVLYVPAARDPSRQLRHTSGTLLSRLLQAIEWSDGLRRKIRDASSETAMAFQAEPGVRLIQETLNRNWSTLHDAAALSQVEMRPFAQQFEEVLRQVEMAFAPGEEGGAHPVDRLSDGLRSLFYLTLIATIFDIERSVQEHASGADHPPLRSESLRTPALTLFAIEEPENHLSPHFLGRTLRLLQRIAKSPGAQVVLTSHCPAILGRVDPADVRHVRLDPCRGAVVHPILLPAEADEAYKFVKEAVRSYPELYFARAVVLCEGDSEELVLPRLAGAMGVAVDESCVSVVPLGGRHVNHFWRLLHGLSIPHLTLLDLDRERFGGGWGRIKYAIEQLLAVGEDEGRLLSVQHRDGSSAQLSRDDLSQMHTWAVGNLSDMRGWIQRLEQNGVYYSQPLDLDFAMLRAFGTEYRNATTGTGPRVPDRANNPVGYRERLEQARSAVLKENGTDGSTFTASEREDFIWYHYLFLDRGKPVTHLLALNEIPTEKLASDAPEELKGLIRRLGELLSQSAAEETEDASFCPGDLGAGRWPDAGACRAAGSALNGERFRRRRAGGRQDGVVGPARLLPAPDRSVPRPPPRPGHQLQEGRRP